MMKKKNFMIIAVIMAAMVISVFTIFFTKEKGQETGQVSGKDSSSIIAKTNEQGDLVIPLADITEKAKFYSYDGLDSKMEVIAVKAPDGTIRTAFNTCQVCFSSGKGYYVQEGDKLVCQNCGNQFGMDQVEMTKGGCNPVPILEDQKQVNGDKIIIPKQTLKEAESIFKNWKI